MNETIQTGITLCRYDYLAKRGLKVHASTLRRWEQARRFPRRVRPGGSHTVAWIQSEIDDFLANLAAQREAA